MARINRIVKGDWVKLGKTDKRFGELNDLREKALLVEEIYKEGQLELVKFVGENDAHWLGYFEKLPNTPKFKPGTKVKYSGRYHRHLIDKHPQDGYTIEHTKHFGLDSQFLVKLKEDKSYYTETCFDKIMVEPAKKKELPWFSDILWDLCNDNKVNEKTDLSVNIVNSNVKGDANYTKGDVVHVLRILQENGVNGTVYFASAMDDAMCVVIDGRDVMEELSNPKGDCKPISAIIEMSCHLDITVGFNNFNTIYVIGYGGVVYESREISVSAMQAAGNES